MNVANHGVLVVLSGGQDSTTCLADILQSVPAERVYAVTFNYGQRHSTEIAAAAAIAFHAGIEARHEVIDIPDILKGTSPLVNSSIDVEQYADAAALPGGLEKTFVPMRNQLFLTIAANRAVVLAQEHGWDDVYVITGVSQEDYGGYPDCREIFIRALALTLATSLDSPELPSVQIITPLLNMTKRETVLHSESIPGARALLSHSHTCYNGEIPPCGKCHACLLREKGYAEAGVEDPLIQRLEYDRKGTTDLHREDADDIPF